jgi:5'-phosphate synthase pdxT subunit
LLDLDVRRNGYGRQVDSFEAELDVAGLAGGRFHGVFIRAPRIERVGPAVEVLAEYHDDPVLVRSGACLGATFHPELAGDLRLHEAFMSFSRESFNT